MAVTVNHAAIGPPKKKKKRKSRRSGRETTASECKGKKIIAIARLHSANVRARVFAYLSPVQSR